jgi:hypothetical protein
MNRDLDKEIDAAFPTLEAVVAKAHDLIAGQCSGRRQWRMTIPVRHDDHDILISAALDRQTAEIARLAKANQEWCDRLREAISVDDPKTASGHCMFCGHGIGTSVLGVDLYQISRHEPDCIWLEVFNP